VKTYTQFFGQYLLQKGRITAEQLLAAVNLQGRVNVMLGTIAVDRGYLTATDVQRINLLQRSRDERFGELAIELGLLTESQLQELLASQKQDRLFLGEALVQQGYLTAEEMCQELESFIASQAQTGPTTSIAGLYRGLEQADILEAITDICTKFFLRIAHFTVRPSRPHHEAGSLARFDYAVTQRFSGSFDGDICLNLGSDLVLQIAGEMLEEKLPAVDDTALDAAMEFVNLLSGNVCGKLSQLGHPSEITAPRAYGKTDRPADLLGKGGRVVVTPLVYPEGEGELCVIIRSIR
jgi:CheY-specific phosphatase CheX